MAWNLIQVLCNTEEIVISNTGVRNHKQKEKVHFGFTKWPALFVFWPMKHSDMSVNAGFSMAILSIG